MKIKLKDDSTNMAFANKSVRLQIKDTQNKIRTLDVKTDDEGKIELSKEDAGKLVTTLIGNVQKSPWVVVGENTEIKVKTHTGSEETTTNATGTTGSTGTGTGQFDKDRDGKKKEKSREGQY